MNTNRNEHGQALVLIVLAILGMMAFAALAIDGGMMYAERRRAQNAADAAAYAAALAGVQGKSQAEIQTLAENVLEANGFDTDEVGVKVGTPESGPYEGNPSYYQIVIDMSVKPTFSQFLFSGGIPMRAEAVARGQGGTTGTNSSAANNAIWGLKQNDTSVRFSGSVTVMITGGNIYGRGNGDKDGGNSKGTYDAGVYLLDSASTIQVSGPSWTGKTSGIWKGDPASPSKAPYTPVINAPVQSDPVIAQPLCPLEEGVVNGNTYNPGLYKKEIKLNGKVTYTFNPGLYCLENGMTVNGASTLKMGGVTEGGPNGLLFVVTGGNIKLNGKSKTMFPAASDITDAGGTQYGGLLFYVANGGELALLGTAGTQMWGTIYNPKGTCEFGGNGDKITDPEYDPNDTGARIFHSQVICNDVWAHGNARVKFDYNAKNVYNPNSVAIIDLMQ